MEKQNSIILPIILAILISAVVFGAGGYYLANSQDANNTTTVAPNYTEQTTITTASPTITANVTPSSVATLEPAKVDNTAIKKFYDAVKEINLNSKLDNNGKTNFKELKQSLETVFGPLKLVENYTTSDSDIQPNSFFILASSRMILPEDIQKIQTQLTKVGYKDIQTSNYTVFGQKGTQYTYSVNISVDVNDSGRALIRVVE